MVCGRRERGLKALVCSSLVFFFLFFLVYGVRRLGGDFLVAYDVRVEMILAFRLD